MLIHPLIADRHPSLGGWLRAFSRAGFRAGAIAALFNMDASVVRTLLKEFA